MHKQRKSSGNDPSAAIGGTFLIAETACRFWQGPAGAAKKPVPCAKTAQGTVFGYGRGQAARISNFSTPSAAVISAIISSSDSCISLVSAVTVTPAQPLVGMV